MAVWYKFSLFALFSIEFIVFFLFNLVKFHNKQRENFLPAVRIANHTFRYILVNFITISPKTQSAVLIITGSSIICTFFFFNNVGKII